ncbi:hypothetical protein L596_009964 [Steinernema carpocapsae]|uniref:SKP1 component POZ domain-containing protein n=1 Tax=Steinernema carpocapsae TaxID=34508 RepID=A0A4U5PHP4_STECR|nr:hypothetical protein L596_009964 [Steinernema carpocapsae]
MSSRTASVIANDGANYSVPVESATMMGKLKRQLDIRRHAFVQLKEGSARAFEKVLQWCKYCTSPESGLDKKRNITGRDGFMVAQSDFGENFFVDLDVPALLELINLAEELVIPSLEYGGTLILHRIIDNNSAMDALRKFFGGDQRGKEELFAEIEQLAKDNMGDWSDDDGGNPQVRQKFLEAVEESFADFDFDSAGFTKEELDAFVNKKATELGRW